MTPTPESIVFDTGPLRHFAEQDWLGVLRFLTRGRRVFIPDSVQRELDAVVDLSPKVRSVLEADWIDVYRSTDLRYAEAFGRFADRLVSGTRNVGECGVLAMGELFGSEMVIDDADPRGLAEHEGLHVTSTVPLLCDAIRQKQLTTAVVESIADDLLAGTYFLPFGRGGFRQHVIEHGLLDYAEL